MLVASVLRKKPLWIKRFLCESPFSRSEALSVAYVNLALASTRDRFFAVIGALLLVAASALLLKSFGFRGAPVVAAVGIVAALSYYGEALSEIFAVFTYLDTVSDTGEYVSAALKIIGISYLSGISADVCREIGEGGVAKCISVITRLELIALSLPFIKEIISLALSLADS